MVPNTAIRVQVDFPWGPREIQLENYIHSIHRLSSDLALVPPQTAFDTMCIRDNYGVLSFLAPPAGLNHKLMSYGNATTVLNQLADYVDHFDMNYMTKFSVLDDGSVVGNGAVLFSNAKARALAEEGNTSR